MTIRSSFSRPLSRRTFVRVGGLTALGLGLSSIPGLTPSPANAAATAPTKKATRCILIWLDGGPSHLETFDPKPKAPVEVRGPLSVIRTNAPGIEICEGFSRLAKRMHQAAVVRSVTSPLGEHNLGAQYMLTGYQPTPALEHPALGSIVAHLDGVERTLPPHIAIPNHNLGGAGFPANGFLPAGTRPFEVGGDPARENFRIEGLNIFPGLNEQRLDRRREYLAALSRFDSGLASSASDADSYPFEQAYRLISSAEAKAAFDLTQEKDEVRARYGSRSIGQSTLLARRLVEAGVPFVTVNYPGWDTHSAIFTRLQEGFTGATNPVGLVPSLDLALSGLLDDLSDRGLLDETLVVVMGEFGRTPKLNTQGGRDHWPRVFSVLLAGGGVAGGRVVGSSDATGESPKDHPVTPADLSATIFTLLGIDPQQLLHTSDGRPIHISRDGKPIRELLG